MNAAAVPNAPRAVRRAAGLRFVGAPAPLRDPLPRMDVAAFVGFAASGPLHVPVPIDDPASFASIFGADAPLAWDVAQGQVRNAFLAPAVRSFFANGGVRCWVVRVAAPGQTNAFGVPGLVRVDAHDGSMIPAALPARSQGSWSDDILVAAALRSRPLVPVIVDGSSLAGWPAFLDVVTTSADDVIVGDLVRVTFDAPTETRVAMFVVGGTGAPGAAASGAGATLHLTTRADDSGAPQVWWFRSTPPGLVAGSRGTVGIGGGDVPMTLASFPGPGFSPQILFPAATYTFEVEAQPAAIPAAGSTLAFQIAGSTLWAVVQSVTATSALSGSPPAPKAVVSVAGLFVDSPPVALPAGGVQIERLRLDLWTRVGLATPAPLTSLGFDASHPRALWALPSDEELFREPDDPAATDDRAVELRLRADDVAALWSDASNPRFALACADAPGALFLPVAVPYTPGFFIGPPPADAPLARDGLASFDATLFMDPDLVDVPLDALVTEANFIHYQSEAPRRLQGVHAALEIEEATVIAVPDAALPGWIAGVPFVPAGGAPAAPLVPGAAGAFVTCDARRLALPAPAVGPVTPEGSFTLEWPPVDGATSYEIQQSPDPAPATDDVTRTTAATSIDVYGQPPGILYFRVRARDGALNSGWSATLGVVVPYTSGYVVALDDANPAPALLDVQSAVLQVCAARGDLFAILSLPPFLDAVGAARHASRLAAEQPDPGLAFGAAYHPWIIARDDAAGPLETMPPDGAIAGIYAKRALARGAWVAPANELLDASVVGLVPRLSNDAWMVLDELPVNRVRSEARGLMPMSATTLSGDVDSSPVNVRRLLALLRRAAVRQGNVFAFEPNGDRLARNVQGTFTALLDGLYRRGAFAGATADASYRVVADATVNPPASVDQGRFVVELQVAPSLPLEFLTVRMVQQNGAATITEGRA
jgi:hypothetical protein